MYHQNHPSLSPFFFCSRLSTIFTILSLAIIFSACLFTLFGHCLRGGKMLVASGLYAFGGELVIFQNGKSKSSFADDVLRAVY